MDGRQSEIWPWFRINDALALFRLWKPFEGRYQVERRSRLLRTSAVGFDQDQPPSTTYC
jgi:hypothetical protein